MFTANGRSHDHELDPRLTEGGGIVRAPPGAEPRLWSRSFVDLVAVQALFGFAYSLFVLLPKVLAVSFHAGPRQIGIVMASFGVASLLAIPAIAPLVRRLGHRGAIGFAACLFAGTALGMVFITRAGAAAALLRGLQGISWSLFFAAGMSIVADVAPPARLGQAIGLFGAAALAMTAVGPAVAEPLAAARGPVPVFLLAAAIAGAAVWYSRRLPASSRATPPGSTESAPAIGSARTRRAVLLVLAVGGMASATMFTFVAPFALAQGIRVVRGFFIAYTVTALAVRVGGARLIDRLGHRRAAMLASAAYGAVVIATGLLGPRFLIVLGALFGVAHGVVFPALMALVLGGASPAERPRLLAFANGAINLAIVALWPLGLLADLVGYPAMFVGIGAVTIGSAASLIAAPRARVSASST